MRRDGGMVWYGFLNDLRLKSNWWKILFPSSVQCSYHLLWGGWHKVLSLNKWLHVFNVYLLYLHSAIKCCHSIFSRFMNFSKCSQTHVSYKIWYFTEFSHSSGLLILGNASLSRTIFGGLYFPSFHWSFPCVFRLQGSEFVFLKASLGSLMLFETFATETSRVFALCLLSCVATSCPPLQPPCKIIIQKYHAGSPLSNEETQLHKKHKLLPL